MSKNILIINGPNLNLLGKREPNIYGNQDFLDYFNELKTLFPNCALSYFQTNHEGEIIDKLHHSEGMFDAIIINPGGYTHTSIAIGDAISSITLDVIEVHITNVYTRETFRHISYISKPCLHSIIGEGLGGYKMAIQSIISPPKLKPISAILEGKVQGVWYRQTTYTKANSLKLRGIVKNETNGTVYVEAIGSIPNINTFIKYLHRGPEYAMVSKVIINEIPTCEYKEFQIQR